MCELPLLLATGLFFHDSALLWRMVALIILYFITGPIATTTMARAAYRTGKHTDFKLSVDEMKDEKSGYDSVPEADDRELVMRLAF